METLSHVLPDLQNTGHATTLNLRLMLCEVELNFPIGLLWRDTVHNIKSPVVLNIPRRFVRCIRVPRLGDKWRLEASVVSTHLSVSPQMYLSKSSFKSVP